MAVPNLAESLLTSKLGAPLEHFVVSVEYFVVEEVGVTGREERSYQLSKGEEVSREKYFLLATRSPTCANAHVGTDARLLPQRHSSTQMPQRAWSSQESPHLQARAMFCARAHSAALAEQRVSRAGARQARATGSVLARKALPRLSNARAARVRGRREPR